MPRKKLARARRQKDSRQRRLSLFLLVLYRDTDYKVHARIHRVAQVIHTVDLDHINVLRVKPVAGPRATESKPIAAVLEAATAVLALTDAKRVFASEVSLVTVGGNPVTTGA